MVRNLRRIQEIRKVKKKYFLWKVADTSYFHRLSKNKAEKRILDKLKMSFLC